MRKIEIHMRDVYRGLGAGRRIVTYVGFEKGRLVCLDSLGQTVRVPRSMFTFVGVLGRETRVTESGHVEVKDDGGWQDVGVLFGHGREPDPAVARSVPR